MGTVYSLTDNAALQKNDTIKALIGLYKSTTGKFIVPSSNNAENPSNPDNTIEDGVAERQRKDQPGHIAQNATAPERDLPEQRPEEHGGQTGPEPTRYGDWEKKGRCTDF